MPGQTSPRGGQPERTSAETAAIHPPFTLEYEIRGFECGYGGPLKPLPLLNLIQEAAGAHADRLGWGVDDLQAAGRTWMLSRLDLRALRLPRAGERVRVSTWPAGSDRLFALRDFVMRGPEGELFAAAVYAYLIVDLATRRPLRPERVFGPVFPHGTEPHPVEGYSFAVPEVASSLPSFALHASTRHLDNNGHVNNAHIADWLVDAVPRSERSGGSLRALRVEFGAEVLEGDELQALWGRPGGPAQDRATPPGAVVSGGAAAAETSGGAGPRGGAVVSGGAAASQVVTELRRGDELAARAWTLWA